MNKELEKLIREIANTLPERKMLTLTRDGDKIRENEFSPLFSNAAYGQDGFLVMRTGSFGPHTLQLVKAARAMENRSKYSWDQAVWFIVEPNAIVFPHIDDDYGEFNNRARYHQSFCVGGECTFIINGNDFPMAARFNPGTELHGAWADYQGAVILQLPEKPSADTQ